MRLRVTFLVVPAVSLLVSTGCGRRTVAVEYRRGFAFSETERTAIETIADRAAKDVRALLPTLPVELRITVQTGTRVIPETGETASTGLPGGVYWTVDPGRPGGVIGIVNAQLRATLFHEFYHLVREAKLTPVSLIDCAVDEGLATAFERDHGGAPVPWGAYPDNVAAWTQEFLALPADAPRDRWMFKHEDGRRWIGFKVGTYLADRAERTSGLSLSQLATVPTDRIIEWARSQR